MESSVISQITDYLYLTGVDGVTESNLNKLNVKCVLTVCEQIPELDFKQVENIVVNVDDRPTVSLEKYFDSIADKINEVTKNKEACLVHCVVGVSRSTTMVLAYLMKHLKMSLKDAFLLVRSKRSFVRPNSGFFKQLIDYEFNLFGKNSVSMVPTSIGFIPDIYKDDFDLE